MNEREKFITFAKEVFEFIGGENQGIFVCPLRSQFATLLSPEEIIKIGQRKEHYFFFPSVMKKETVNGKTVCKRTQEAVEKVQFVFADLDILEKVEKESSKECLEETKKRLENTNLPQPNIITYTGRGIHLLWKINPSENLELFREIQKKIAEILSSDSSVINPNRILRLPYSWNMKYNIKTRILSFHPENTYTIEHFQKLFGIELGKKPKSVPKEVNPVRLNYNFEKTSNHKSGKHLVLDKIVEIVKPYYIEGYRNKIMLYLVGMLLKKKVEKEDILYVFENLTENDEERKNRYMQTVDFQFRKDVNTLSGSSGLENTIQEIMEFCGVQKDVAKKQAHTIIIKINSYLDEYVREYIKISDTFSFVITAKNILVEYNNGKSITEEIICPTPIQVIYYDGYSITFSVNGNIYTVDENQLLDVLPEIVPNANYAFLATFIQILARKIFEKLS